ncbi:hypothetical protein EYF80_063434 [Liparis tanakae]|uniref:Uncharacterized protein n=1 Tax=Liparis tanakae TaxID=230148 RepID=A0A4Z2EC79_9TELE|nr:hypothetical protein EYF80_063434 [Liparis tanakae]
MCFSFIARFSSIVGVQHLFRGIPRREVSNYSSTAISQRPGAVRLWEHRCC